MKKSHVMSIQEFRKIQQPGTRRCSDCGKIKSLEEFYKCSSGYMSRCKKCDIKRSAERAKTQKEKARLRERNRRPEEREKRREYRKKKKEQENTRNGITKKEQGPTRTGFIYIYKWGKFYKIGRAQRPKSRIKAIDGFLPYRGEIICIIRTNDMPIAEAHVHDKYSHLRQNGEWFVLSNSDVDFLCNLLSLEVNIDNFQVKMIKK